MGRLALNVPPIATYIVAVLALCVSTAAIVISAMARRVARGHRRDYSATEHLAWIRASNPNRIRNR